MKQILYDNYYLKGQCNEIFGHICQESNPASPLINRLKRLRKQFRFRGDIRGISHSTQTARIPRCIKQRESNFVRVATEKRQETGAYVLFFPILIEKLIGDSARSQKKTFSDNPQS